MSFVHSQGGIQGRPGSRRTRGMGREKALGGAGPGLAALRALIFSLFDFVAGSSVLRLHKQVVFGMKSKTLKLARTKAGWQSSCKETLELFSNFRNFFFELSQPLRFVTVVCAPTVSIVSDTKLNPSNQPPTRAKLRSECRNTESKRGHVRFERFVHESFRGRQSSLSYY